MGWTCCWSDVIVLDVECVWGGPAVGMMSATSRYIMMTCAD